MTVNAQELAEKVRQPIDLALESQGLTAKYLVQKLKRELNAKVTKRIKVKGAVVKDELARGHSVAAESGTIRYEKDDDGNIVEAYGDGDSVIQVDETDWTTRQKARQDAHKLRGDYAPEKVDHTHHIDTISPEEREILKEFAKTRAKQVADGD